MKILFISHTPIGGDFVVGSHHLAREISDLGHQVLHISPPITPFHLKLVFNSGFRKKVYKWLIGGVVYDGVIDCIPFSFLTWELSKFFGPPESVFFKCFRKSFLSIIRKYSFVSPDIIFIDEPRMGHVLSLFPDAKIVYRPTDIYSCIRDDNSIIDAEKFILNRAESFVATSQPVLEHLENLGVQKILLLENGVDLNHFLDSTCDIELLPSGPVAIYVGALDKRFGWESIFEAAKKNPYVSFVLIGPCESSLKIECTKYKNIHLIGSVEYKLIPSYLRKSDLALLPLSNHAANQGRSPMKIFEYAAVGLNVVSTETTELKRRALSFVRLASTKEEFADFVKDYFKSTSSTMKNLDAIEFARLQSWKSKAIKLLEYVQQNTK